MSIVRKEIARNVFLNTVPADKFKSDLIRVTFLAPLSEKTASAYALVPAVLNRGNEAYPTLGAIRKELESLYDSSVWDNVGKRGDVQLITLGAGHLGNRFTIDDTDVTKGVLDMLEQTLFHPVLENGAFKAEYVESEKKHRVDEILGDDNNKIAYSARRCEEEMFAGDAYALRAKGDPDSVRAITPEQLYGAYLDLIHKARIEIFAVGSQDMAYVEKRFSAMFAGVPREAGVDLSTNAPKAARAEVKRVYEHQNIGQGKLTMGFTTGICRTDPDFLAMQLASVIYGGSTSSKLFMNVRERLSLCYYCSGSYNAVKGAILVRSGIEFAKKKEAIDEILAQLKLLQAGEITDDEIGDAKNTIKNQLRAVTDRTGAMADWQFEGVMTGRPETTEERMARIDAVTKDEIVRAAGHIALDTVYFLCGMEVKEDD